MTPAIVGVMTPRKIGTVSKGTARRTVRIDDELWEAAARKADEGGKTVSDVIRGALETYVADFEDDPEFTWGYWLGYSEALDGFRNWLTIDGSGDDLHEVVRNKVLLKIEAMRRDRNADEELANARRRGEAYERSDELD